MRRLWLETNGLLSSASGPVDVVAIIKKLGFVQLDTIQNVSRAHHHILWSRHSKYREPMLDDLLSAREYIFEHFTHDASVLPMDMYPMWQRRFKRLKSSIDGKSWHKPDRVRDWRDVLIERITKEGPLSTKDFDSKISGKKQVWSRPPHKHVLEYLWYSGTLATSHREKFAKFYDLAERVIPEQYRETEVSDVEQIDWLCRAALDRLAVGTPKEIKEFWEAKDVEEVKTWIEENRESIVPIQWETDTGEWITSYALEDIEERIEKISSVPSRIKILNPFDPAVRNRTRLKSIFGFDYKLEVFVPAAKRRWGYYVYPLLEGDRFVGRIEAKADRKAGCLNVLNFWPEEGVKWGTGREKKLEAELSRFAQLAGLDSVNYGSLFQT
ncbi:winged helix-turn-helix domain-containing protein [Emcibacter nanhaiensis]|uniref:Winged helix-turn-helix domain-containing protein n=2 Tax=Emcibacter nanhaiensis TaxID=1505037 RepID=A0A501PT21_9PROT|nr:winged helix-turn-helix domain-containing protein [Emcibacter nanhaiensis]